MNIVEFILAIKNRPLMFVEQVKIDYVYYLLKGYVGCRLSSHQGSEIDYIFHSEFYQWVLKWANENSKKKFEKKESFYWHRILSEVSNNEQEAVDLFFKLSEEFFKEYM